MRRSDHRTGERAGRADRRRRGLGLLLGTATLLGGLGLTALPSPAAAQGDQPGQVALDNPTIVVDSRSDGADASGADGVCATSGGDCTLRAAIEQANYNQGTDRIEFDIPGGGVRRINLGTGLPSINDATGGLTIDGYTQPGAAPNTLTDGSNADIRIEIRGPELEIMTIESAENTIRGLAIYDGSSQIELRGEGADGNLIVGNFIGTDASADHEGYDGVGVIINLGPDLNRIGTPDLADRNIVSGSGTQGIRINHGETSQNRVQNNVVGLSPDGTEDLGHNIGIDLQWWTWGNLVGGTGPHEHNVFGGNNNGIDVSHKATENLIIGNYVGTTLDGRSADSTTREGKGIILKDDPVDNYFADNVLAGAEGDAGIWHKHNYTGGNAFVNNRIGVAVDGSDIGSDSMGMLLRGHDDVYHGNTFANVDDYTVVISNTSIRDEATFEPDEQTTTNTFRQGTYYGNSTSPITFGTLCCPHPDEDTPRITGIGPGQVNGDRTCADCEVEVYVSGSVNADGSLSPGTGTTGLTWIGTVYADSAGFWSMASPLLTVGSRVAVSSNTPSGEASDFTGTQTIPAQGSGLVPDPDQPISIPPPVAPPEPPIYQPEIFTCSYDGGVLTWSDAGAEAYYVFATTDGTESYLGGHPGTSLATAGADSYRVEHWVRGIATNAICDGPGPDEPPPFDCAYADGTLSWDDAGVIEYYVFATTDGIESYLGGHPGTSLATAGADSYRVEHWATGQATNATCDGPGPDEPPPFDCSHVDGVLSWDDAGAAQYYVFATPTAGGGETYLGGHPGTSLAVSPADSYRVEHWVTGQATNATCDGPGPPAPFSCSVAAGVLSWDDAGASQYYVFATPTPGAGETYLGGHPGTSLAVDPADSYRVEHWVTGQATNATCSA